MWSEHFHLVIVVRAISRLPHTQANVAEIRTWAVGFSSASVAWVRVPFSPLTRRDRHADVSDTVGLLDRSARLTLHKRIKIYPRFIHQSDSASSPNGHLVSALFHDSLEEKSSTHLSMPRQFLSSQSSGTRSFSKSLGSPSSQSR